MDTMAHTNGSFNSSDVLFVPVFDETSDGNVSPWIFAGFMVIQVLVVPTNGVILWALYREKRFRTRFTMYLINVLCAHLVSDFVRTPLALLRGLRLESHLGSSLHAYVIADYALLAGKIFAHVLPAAMRLIGTRFPMFYVVHHTKRVAVGLCFGAWLCVLLVVIPAAVINASEFDELLNVVPILRSSRFLLWFVHYVPEIIVLITCPLILFVAKPSRRRGSLEAGASVKSRPGHGSVRRQQSMATSEVPKARRVIHSRRKMILTGIWYSLSVLIAWTPIGCTGFFPTTLTLDNIARLLFETQAVFDVILVLGTQDDVRDYVQSAMRCLL